MRLMWRKKEEAPTDYPRSESDSDASWASKNATGGYGFHSKDKDKSDVEIKLPPIVRLANTIIQAAIKERASDIHIEPDRRNTRIRYRVNSFLHEVMVIPDYIHSPLITQLREMTGLPPESTARPQSGSIEFRFSEADYRLRVHLLPTQHGEKVVLHISKQPMALIGLSKLGMTPETQSMFEDILIKSGGLIVFAGHTGSGITTTQFNALNRLNTVERTSFVIGQRLEYELAGVGFVQVDPKAGLTYEEAIAAVRYESPGIVLIDQIPDVNVWRMALDLAHSGTIVLASICAHDSVAAFIRLLDMGISPSSIAYGVSGVLCQSLVRRPCHHCQRTEDTDPNLLYRFGLIASEVETLQIVKAVGCEQCRQTGYVGRMGIFEYLPQSDETIRALTTLSGIPLRDALLTARFQTFRHDAAVHLLEGHTTLEEIHRIFGNTLSFM